MSKQWRVGVVGVGSIAKLGHLPFYRDHPDVDLVAVADVNLTRAHAVGEEYGMTRIYGDALQMFDAKEVEAVSICTDNESHVPLAIAAMERGIHVLVEKPLATRFADARRVEEVANRTGCLCMVGMTHRYRNEAQALHKVVRSGALGEIYYAKARILRRRGTPAGWFTSRQKSGGGTLMDIGVHALDLGWWLMGEPTLASASGILVKGIGRYDTKMVDRWKSSDAANQDNAIFDVEDFAAALVRFEGGSALQLEVSWALNGPQDDALQVEVFGSKGGISLSPLCVFGEQAGFLAESQLSVDGNSWYQDEIGHFIDCLQDGTSPLSTVQQGVQVVEMLETIQRSASVGFEVRKVDERGHRG
ncbi:MAG: Gfo/Idh/MocA family oxidoreductase [Alicyclobacillaceae bacterium]|nr:Gfo/Idh/MocA family oxidoreductase [Alicyclobacillaceae bacterium]